MDVMGHLLRAVLLSLWERAEFIVVFVSFLLFSMSDLLGTNTIKMHSNIRLLQKYLNTVSSYLLTDLHEQFGSGSGLQPLLRVALSWTAIFSNTTVRAQRQSRLAFSMVAPGVAAVNGVIQLCSWH